VALKLFLWPMIFWLLATRRWAAAAAAGALSVATFLSVLPFVSLTEYLRLMNHLGDTFGPQGFGVIGLLSQLGTPFRGAQVAALGVGLSALLVSWRRRSFVLAICASLLLSPIVWLHYFILLAVPLALRWRSLSWPWAVPLAMWCCTEATHGSIAWQTAIALACFGVVAYVTEFPNARAIRLRSALSQRFAT
jgi:hypothetical protein